MPSKKTFYSIRVRGHARFDHPPVVSGVALGGVRQMGLLLNQDGVNAPTMFILLNNFGYVPQSLRIAHGMYKITIPGGFPQDRTLVLVGQCQVPGYWVSAGVNNEGELNIVTQSIEGDLLDGVLGDVALFITAAA